MKILFLDIETSPNIAYVWGLFKENIPLARLKESSYTLCWAAKWYGEDKVHFSSTYHDRPKTMLRKIHKLLDEADMVVHYYGSRFDIPTLNKEFLLHGLTPPAPYKQVDLCTVVRRKFKFVSNKLDYVAGKLGLGKKHDTDFMLWVRCMENDKAAWEQMEAYNVQDVVLLEKVYEKLLPWIKGHANLSNASEAPCCPNCGSLKNQKRGYYYSATLRYQRHRCNSCGNWFRSREADKNHKGKYVNIG